MFWKVFFLVLGALLGLIFLLNLVFYGIDLKDPLFLPTAVSAIVILVSWLFFEKFTGPFKAIFRILAVFSFFWAIVVFVIVGILIRSSFPRQGPFVKNVELPETTAQQGLVYDEYLKVNQEFGNQFIPQIDEVLEAIKDGAEVDLSSPENLVLAESVATFLSFFEDNQISVPKKFWNIGSLADLPDFRNLETAIKFQLLMLDENHEAGQTEQACTIHEQLWQVLKQLTMGRTGLYGSIPLYRFLELLEQAFLNQPSIVQGCDRDPIVALMDEILARLDSKLRDAFLIEFAITKNTLDLCHLEDRAFEEMSGSNPLGEPVIGYEWIMRRIGHGPLYDHQRWIFKLDDLFGKKLLKACNTPFHQFEVLPEQRTRFKATMALINDPSAFETRTGRTFYRTHLWKKERAKSKLTAFRFLFSTPGVEEAGDPPIDNLTGEPFLLFHDATRTRIKSASEEVLDVDLTLQRENQPI